MLKVGGELVRVKEGTVAVVYRLGRVPVVEGCNGLDAARDETVDQVVVEGDPLLVDGVVASSEGNDAGPGDREAVRINVQGVH